MAHKSSYENYKNITPAPTENKKKSLQFIRLFIEGLNIHYY